MNSRAVSPVLTRLEILKLDSQGDGIARNASGKVVFVPGSLPGETVLASNVTEKKDYATARLVEVEKRAPERVLPFCPLADKCGGCQLQHASYPLQLHLKKQIIEDAFSRIARIEASEGISFVTPSPLLAGYRNKVSLPVSASLGGRGMDIGYYRKGSHRIVNVEKCPVAWDELNALLREVRSGLPRTGLAPYDEKKRQGDLRHVVLRGGQESGEVMAVLVVRRFPEPEVTRGLVSLARRIRKRHPLFSGLVLNLNSGEGNAIFGETSRALSGRIHFTERYGALSFKFEATSFSQINTLQAVNLYTAASEEACPNGDEKVLELYSGVGTLTCFLASRSQQVIAMEEWSPSVKCLRENLAMNGFPNTEVREGAAEASKFSGCEGIDSAVVDPPRSGCHPAVLESLVNLEPKRIVYVSCNPSTLARDAAILCENRQYRLRKVIPFDLFPQTSHVEALAVFERGNSP